uniref:Uncharacterized protein n=1 Tax=Podoviridae sp. ct2m58 TaxID=2827721 RepID=A0A8S5TMB6_9CAUD|nr:MAG TPA: hypothetical protein [Podoviridae sp. ct2m58]
MNFVSFLSKGVAAVKLTYCFISGTLTFAPIIYSLNMLIIFN